MSDNVMVKRALPGGLYDRILETWQDAKAIDGVLLRVPHTLAHGDCHVRNLFASQDECGDDEIVAIDWSAAGIEPLGVDAGTLLGSGFTWRDKECEQSKRLIDPVFDAYLEGLGEAGWKGDVEHARLGYLTVAGLVYGGFFVPILLAAIAGGQPVERIRWLESRLGVKVERVPDLVSERVGLLFSLAEEALSIAQNI
jgi:hypothetical protein